MEALSRFFVQQPLHILAVALLHFVLWGAVRFGNIRTVRHVNAILVPALAWLVYAGWEWLVLAQTPEANIRVDLLIVWPLLVILTIRAMVRMFRS